MSADIGRTLNNLIAERIRALGAKAPGSYAEFGRLTSIPEEDGERTAADMIRDLIRAGCSRCADHWRSVARSLRTT